MSQGTPAPVSEEIQLSAQFLRELFLVFAYEVNKNIDGTNETFIQWTKRVMKLTPQNRDSFYLGDAGAVSQVLLIAKNLVQTLEVTNPKHAFMVGFFKFFISLETIVSDCRKLVLSVRSSVNVLEAGSSTRKNFIRVLREQFSLVSDLTWLETHISREAFKLIFGEESYLEFSAEKLGKPQAFPIAPMVPIPTPLPTEVLTPPPAFVDPREERRKRLANLWGQRTGMANQDPGDIGFLAHYLSSGASPISAEAITTWHKSGEDTAGIEEMLKAEGC